MNTNQSGIDTDNPINKIMISFESQLMRCTNCIAVTDCPYAKIKIDSLKQDAKRISDDIYEEELELDDSKDNAFRAEIKRDEVYMDYLRRNSTKVLKDEKCKYEKDEILEVLQTFVNAKYDLDDPRAMIIIKELIGNLLNSNRTNRAFASMGLALSKQTAGGTVYYANPLLKDRQNFSAIVTEGIQALDSILKSDETQKSENTFTAFLMERIRTKKKVIESDKKSESLINVIEQEKKKIRQELVLDGEITEQI
jgi:hypothetical protein